MFSFLQNPNNKANTFSKPRKQLSRDSWKRNDRNTETNKVEQHTISRKEQKTAQRKKQEDDIKQNKPLGMSPTTYLQLKDSNESSKLTAQAKFAHYKKSQLKQLKRDKYAKTQFNSRIKQFENNLIQRKIEYGSDEYNSLVSNKFPDFAVQQSLGQNQTAQKKERGSNSTSTNNIHTGNNKTGLSDRLKTGIERLSGMDMSDVKVHRNSNKPAQLQAHAFTQGSNIHVAPGQEQHLPHEAWHVVQQKQGRVKPTGTLKKGETINDNPSLEQEADKMGAAAINADSSDYEKPISNIARVNNNLVQKKEVDTKFGVFKTTKFENRNNEAADIHLEFHPNEKKVDAKLIGLSQSIKGTDPQGDTYAIDPTSRNRMVKEGKKGEGYYIDQKSNIDNPLYSQEANLGKGKDLEDTPRAASDNPQIGVNTNYELGHCYRVNPTDKKKEVHPASMSDGPTGHGQVGRSKMFETTALAIDGVDKDSYYGSVKWGFKIEGSEEKPQLKLFDISLASKKTPTENFMNAAKLWNDAKTRGTLEISADPYAYVKIGGSRVMVEELPKGTKLRQIEKYAYETGQEIEVEVLNSDGEGTGKIVSVETTDVVDKGDGSETKNLPVK